MKSVSRRKFIQSFVGAVASVSIGLKLSHGMPELPGRIDEVRVTKGVAKFKATERFLEPKVDWRCVYGSPG